MSDQGNQHNNGPHQDQIFDNPLCSLLSIVGRKSDSAPGMGWRGEGGGGVEGGRGGGGGTDTPNRLFMKGIGLSLSLTFLFSLFKAYQI